MDNILFKLYNSLRKQALISLLTGRGQYRAIWVLGCHFLLKICFYFMCIGVSCFHISLWTMCVKCPKVRMGVGYPGTGIIVVSYHVGVGNWTWVHWKSSQFHMYLLWFVLLWVGTCGGQRILSGVSLHEPPTVFSEEGSLIDLGLADIAKLICSWDLGSFFLQLF